MSDTILFNGVQIGDSGRLLVPEAEALSRSLDQLLWSTFAHVDDSSRNWVYRIRASVVVTRTSDWKLMQYIGGLRASLGGAKADLVWKTGAVERIRWPNARLDAIRPSVPADKLQASRDASLVLEFTCANDPTIPE